IGAGAAGLAAAERLTTAGLSIIIVEARDRVGGRIHTVRPAGWPVPVEAGAEFIHGRADVIWNAVRSQNLSTCEVSENDVRAVRGRRYASDFASVWRRVFGRLEELATDELSFADFLARYRCDMSAEERAQATAYVEGFNAA